MTLRLVYEVSCRFLGALHRVVNLKIGRSLCASRKILRTTYNMTTANNVYLPYLTESSMHYVLAFVYGNCTVIGKRMLCRFLVIHYFLLIHPYIF